MRTADLCDAHEGKVRVADAMFHAYGGRSTFSGPAHTLRVFEDNALVRRALEQPGNGRVLVVDGGGSRARALVGGNLAKLAEENGWAGVLVHGAVRDVLELRAADVGVLALGLVPRRAEKTGAGEVGVPLSFAGITVAEGEIVYADEDGVVISATALTV